jgi:hypothetical protein
MAEPNWVKAWPIIDREHMIGWLALQGYVPMYREVGPGAYKRYVAIQAPAARESIYELATGCVGRGMLMPFAWAPGEWRMVSDKLLHAFFLQVHNHEP